MTSVMQVMMYTPPENGSASKLSLPVRVACRIINFTAWALSSVSLPINYSDDKFIGSSNECERVKLPYLNAMTPITR